MFDFILLYAAAILFSLTSCEADAESGCLMFVNRSCAGEDFHASSSFPAAALAIEKVNTDIPLSGINQLHLCYNISWSSLESECSNIGVIIDPGCAEGTANTMSYSNFTEYCSNSILITYAFSSVPSNNLAHFHMLPYYGHLASGLSKFVVSFTWTRMIIITQNLSVFTMISQRLKDSIKSSADADISISEYTLSTSDHSESLFPPNHRIFVLNMYPNQARAVLCQAYERGMLYPNYVWITYGWYYDDEWWRIDDESYSSCSGSERAQVLTGAIALSHYPLPVDEESTMANSLTDIYSRLVYDAVLAYGSSLNNTQTGFPLDALKKLNITGVSGQISFGHDGFRRARDIQILQYRAGPSPWELEMQSVGSIPIVASAGGVKFLMNESAATLWPGGVPRDGAPRTLENYPLLPLMTICYTYATAGICFAVVCLIFNIAFRKNTLVRLTSPNLNYFIIIGAVVFYSSVYTFFYVPQTSWNLVAIVCNARLWLTSFGFSLCYIPINVKMWRVYHICRKPRPSMKNLFMRDWHLVTVVFIFIFLDLLILISVTAITGSRYTVITIPDKENPGEHTNVYDDGYPVMFYVKRCHSSTEYYWISVLFAYKFILQAIGVFLAIRIRKVKIKGLNDSREVSAILYITTVITVAVFLVTFIFGDYINIDGGTYGLGISTATTFVLVLIFVPKMYGLYKDPKGKKIFITPDFQKHSKPVTTGSSQLGTVVDVQGKGCSSVQEDKEVGVMKLDDKETLDRTDNNGATSE